MSDACREAAGRSRRRTRVGRRRTILKEGNRGRRTFELWVFEGSELFVLCDAGCSSRAVRGENESQRDGFGTTQELLKRDDSLEFV